MKFHFLFEGRVMHMQCSAWLLPWMWWNMAKFF